MKPLFLLDDEPIRTHTDDGLGLLEYADVVAGAALGSGGPFTIGVFGKWGQGKTSVLRAARSRLDERATAATKTDSIEVGQRHHPHVVTIWFNAWQFDREEQPIVPLMASIQRAVLARIAEDKTFLDSLSVDGKNALKRLVRAGSDLLSAFKVRGELGVKVPLVAEVKGGVEIDGKSLAAAVQTLIGPEAKASSDVLAESIERCLPLAALDSMDAAWDSAKITTKGTTNQFPRLVVFIDDLDRCQPDKAFEIIEAIKVALAQPGFIFVLGLNRTIVDAYVRSLWKDRMKEALADEADRYLDKIVQLPLFLRGHELMFGRYLSHLDAKMDAGGVTKDVRQVVMDMVDHLGRVTQHSPRAVVRTINQLLVDVRLRPVADAAVHADIRSLSDAGFIGLCFVQRTLQNTVPENRLKDIVADLAFLDALASAGHDSLIETPAKSIDRVGILLAELENRAPSAAGGDRGETATSKEVVASTQWSKDDAVWLQRLRALSLSEEVRYVLSLPAAWCWLESPALRQLVGTFITVRVEAEKLTLPRLSPSDHRGSLGTRTANGNSRGVEGGLEAAASELLARGFDMKEIAEQRSLIEQRVRESLNLANDAPLGEGDYANVFDLFFALDPVSDTGLALLATESSPFAGIGALSLDGSQVTDAGLAYLAAKTCPLTALVSLTLDGTSVGNSGLAYLAAKDSPLTALAHLSLGSTAITDTGLVYLAAEDSALVCMDNLSLSGTGVTDAGLAHLASSISPLKKLTALWLGRTAIDDDGLAALAAKNSSLSALKFLELDGTRITDAGLAHLAASHSPLTSLSNLSLNGTAVGDIGISHLVAEASPLKNLKTLRLRGTKITDTAIAHLTYHESRLTALKELVLDSTAASDEALAHLAAKDSPLTSLAALSVYGTSISDAGLAHLAAKDSPLGALKTLNISKTDVTNAGLERLVANDSPLRSLASLRVTGTKVTEAGIEDFRKRFPQVKIHR